MERHTLVSCEREHLSRGAGHGGEIGAQTEDDENTGKADCATAGLRGRGEYLDYGIPRHRRKVFFQVPQGVQKSSRAVLVPVLALNKQDFLHEHDESEDAICSYGPDHRSWKDFGCALELFCHVSSRITSNH